MSYRHTMYGFFYGCFAADLRNLHSPVWNIHASICLVSISGIFVWENYFCVNIYWPVVAGCCACRCRRSDDNFKHKKKKTKSTHHSSSGRRAGSPRSARSRCEAGRCSAMRGRSVCTRPLSWISATASCRNSLRSGAERTRAEAAGRVREPPSHPPRRLIEFVVAPRLREVHLGPCGGADERGARRELEHPRARGGGAGELQRAFGL